MKLMLNFQLVVFISQIILSKNLNEKNDAAQKKIKKVHIATKLFSILRLLLSVIYTLEESLYNMLIFDGIPGVTKCNL